VTDKKENNSFGKRLKKAIDAKAIALIVLIAYNVVEGFYLTYREGAEQEKYETFKGDAMKLVREETAVPNLMKQLMNSEFVNNFAEGKQREIETVLMKKVLADTGDVSFITLLGIETGLRDKVVEEKFKEMFVKYINGDLESRTISAEF
jgi:hypothetical protein